MKSRRINTIASIGNDDVIATAERCEQRSKIGTKEVEVKKNTAFKIILLIIIFFSANVGFESYMNYSDEYGVTEQQSKPCLVQFITDKCSINSLTN